MKGLLKESEQWADQEQIMPALFIGHGAPMYAVDQNKYTLAWKRLGQDMPTPKAIVSISAHWLTPGETKVCAATDPRTIYDFGGMDPRLYEMVYPAPGAPDLASEIEQHITVPHIGLDTEWGFDHGTWCVLYHMFPEANIPVMQLSIDYSKDGSYHYELGRQLAYLRRKGVLVIASGNIVHNLRTIIWQETAKYDWAIAFDEKARNLLDNRSFDELVHYQRLGTEAMLSIPTPDHYYPLLYVLGMADQNDNLSYPVEGISYGSTSMRAVRFG